ncbi:diphosphomevalonate decarboxylase [Candidatus Woesearchaeota archaeon]|nr:diphosphomevalonate decarboxylase [Candidatus Woesearchaeota archaeon]
MKTSAIADANIALVKYWGKRDQTLVLPQNSSISMVTDGLYAHTTVEFDSKYNRDIFSLNGKNIDTKSKGYEEYVGKFLKIVRKLSANKKHVRIQSSNNFPTAAGLASSAAGFAALTAATNKAFALGLNKRELSILARQGSGSACRSIHSGFVEWRRGGKMDGSDSYAEQIADAKYWPEFRMIFCITTKKEKKIKSRAGMAQTVATSAMYKCWLDAIVEDLKNVRQGIIQKSFSLVGKTAEHNCLKMHSLMLTTKPPIIYWNEFTIRIINKIIELRENGLECYFTIDAGPQVKIICLESNIPKIVRKVQEITGIEDIIITKPGQGARIVNKHLF